MVSDFGVEVGGGDRGPCEGGQGGSRAKPIWRTRLVGAPTVSRRCGGAPFGRMERERHALGAGESHGLDDVRLRGHAYDRIGPVPDGAVESVHAGGVVGVVGGGQGAGQARSQDRETGHDVAELSCSRDGVGLSGTTTQPLGM